MLHPYLVQGAAYIGYHYITVLYPMRETFKALAQKTFAPSWIRVLTYWIVFAAILLLEPFLFWLKTYIAVRYI